MQKKYDDLFESSKMSFGEHLDELRVALFKALIALGIGFVVGLYFAPDVILFVKKPLQQALDRFQSNRVQTNYLAELKQRIADGEVLDLPPKPEGYSDDQWLEEFANKYAKNGHVPRVIYLDYDPNNPADQTLAASSGTVLRTMPDGRKMLEQTQFTRIVDDPRRDLISTQITGGFMVFIKAALVVGIVAASPLIFYCIWNFVAAGLYPHERHYVYIFLPFSIFLFLAGAALAFFGAIYYVLDFLFMFYEWLDVTPYPVINDWLGFILILPIGFGVSFQLPLVMLFLERIGLFTVEIFLKQWRMAVLVICIISTVLTPADPQSMILMAVPLVFLYFGGIALCHYFPRRRTPFGDVIASQD